MFLRQTIHKMNLVLNNSRFVGQAQEWCDRLVRVIEEEQGKVLVFGNGGSAAQAQHFVAELVVRFKKDRRPIPAIALTADSAILTAAGNDLGFDQIFTRQVEALAEADDILLGISTSGNSKNVLDGLTPLTEPRGRFALFGGQPSKFHTVDALYVPSDDTAIIQDIHSIILHTVCRMLEE